MNFNFNGIVTFIELPFQPPMPYLVVGVDEHYIKLIALRSGIAAYQVQTWDRNDVKILFSYEDDVLLRNTIKELEGVLQDADLTFYGSYVDDAEFAMSAIKQTLAEKLVPSKKPTNPIAPMQSTESQWPGPVRGELPGHLIGIQNGDVRKMVICLAETDGLLSVVSPDPAAGGNINRIRIGNGGWSVYHAEPGIDQLEELILRLQESRNEQNRKQADSLQQTLRDLTGHAGEPGPAPAPAPETQGHDLSLTITLPPGLDRDKVLDIIQGTLDTHPYTKGGLR